MKLNPMKMCKAHDDNVATAKVVDGALILTLPDAVSPTVWRWDLGQVKASALEVCETEKGLYRLLLKTPRGESHDVALFEERDVAVRALMAVSHAMEKAQGQARFGQRDAADDKHRDDVFSFSQKAATSKGEGAKWLVAVGGVLILIILFFFLAQMEPQHMASPGPDGFRPSSDAGSGDAGVPLSADEYLRGF